MKFKSNNCKMNLNNKNKQSKIYNQILKPRIFPLTQNK